MVDIAVIENKSLRLKGKQVTFVIDPSPKMPKTSADAIIVLDGMNNVDVSRVTDSRIIIAGPGSYEVGGAKVSGTKTPKGTAYKFLIDGVGIVLVGSATDAKIEDFNAGQVAIVNTSSDFSESFVTALEPKMVVLYGDKGNEAAKTLGAESTISASKTTITKDKLPEKMEVVVLG